MDETSNFFNWWMLIFTGIQTLGVIVAACFAWKAFSQTQSVSKTQNFVALFEHLKGLREINPQDPHWEDVREAANLLELIGIVWYKDMTHRELLEVAYAHIFLRVYKQVEMSKDPETNVDKGKNTLLNDCPYAVRLNHELHESRIVKLSKRDKKNA